MQPADRIRAVEVGKRTRNAQDAVVPARREAHGLSGLSQEGQSTAIGLCGFFQHDGWSMGVATHVGKAQLSVTLALLFAGSRDPAGDRAAVPGGWRQQEIGGGKRRHFDRQVDAVQQWAGQPRLIIRRATVWCRAPASEPRFVSMPTPARVHGSNQHEARRIGNTVVSAGDRILSDFEGLAQ